jgi:L-aminopeptidase/D-esterase-like protein
MPKADMPEINMPEIEMPEIDTLEVDVIEIDIKEVSAAFKIGQAQDEAAKTGCTAIVCERGAACGADIRGGSPVTADTAALNPIMHRAAVHAVLLSGGSSFGLAAADGARRCLEERKIGRDAGVTVVPNVCAAVLFDLKAGSSKIRPDAAMGELACKRALEGQRFQNGGFGAGTGATVGKARGMEYAMKGGVAAIAYQRDGLRVGAIAAANCVGDVVKGGKIIAGTLDGKGGFAGSEAILLSEYSQGKDFFSENTVLACILTNARFDKAGCAKIAAHGQNGIARAVRPAHSTFDGDTVFCMASGEISASEDAVGILAARAVEEAIWRAVARD